MTVGHRREISVIVPVRDGERYIGAALDSVLGQTVVPDEVLVVDDGSRDSTIAVVSDYRSPVSCIPLERIGVGHALNAGLSRARGELLAFLDADDLWIREKTELQLAALDRDPQLDLVFGQVEQFHSPDLDERERARIHRPPGPTAGIMRGAMLARRESFDAVGPFRADLAPTEFVDWYARAQEAGLRSAVLPELILRRRLHASNLGRRIDQASYARVMREILDRRRSIDRS